ncbi:unnamed protein product, partial [Polarella glacialis]
AKVRRFIGRSPPWSYPGHEVQDWEGVVLDPVRGVPPDASSGGEVSSLVDSSWVIFPPGVFTSGYFMPHGTIHFSVGGEASSSYGPMEWRQATQEETGGADGVFFVQLQDQPRWRAQVEVNKHGTGLAFARDDGHMFVAVRQDMIRTVGEKLLSYLH